MKRIAMWSGPRTISTAMMRAWENRPDTIVVDEPFYANFLVETGIDHPGREDVIAHDENDWRKVRDWLLQEDGDGAEIFYQKHMTHHMLPHIELDWLPQLVNCFLIRRPSESVASYIKVRPNPTADDIGIHRQLELFDLVRTQTGAIPPVIDSNDVLKDPRRVLGALCDALGIEFDDHMLAWPAGKRDTDGVWAPYWYGNVEKSTGFSPYLAKETSIPAELMPMVEELEALYAEMAKVKLG